MKFTCEITKGSTEIITPYIDKTDSEEYKKYGYLHSGVTLKASKVYSPTVGTIVHVGRDGNRYMVTLLSNESRLIRFGNLTSTTVSTGDLVYKGDNIGAIHNRVVKIEYADKYVNSSIWPVHYNESVYYKHDPTDMIRNGYNEFVSQDRFADIPESVSYMLSNNRG